MGKVLLAAGLFLLGCSAGGSAPQSIATADIVTALAPDTASIDAGADLGAGDTGAAIADVASADVAEITDVGLPLPATVPSDLPPGVVAIPLWAGKLDAKGRSVDTKVKIPVDAVSLLTVVLGQHPGFFTLATVIGPDGTPYSKGQCNDLCIACANRTAAAPATGTALLPSSSGVQASAGTWHFVSCGFAWHYDKSLFAPGPNAGAWVDTVLFVKTAAKGQVPAMATIQLRLFLTGAAGLTGQNALTDPRVVGMLAEANKVYASIGVTLTVIDVRNTAPGHTIISLPEDVTVSGQSDLDTLFAEATSAGGSAVIDVFLVDQLVGGGIEGKGIVGGVAGAIPGPAFYHGIPRAGVAIAMGALGTDPQLAGRTLAHELGHFLGLWHPSERDGKTFDPLTDTPECPLALDLNNDGIMDPTECAGQGSEDVMFWFASPLLVGFTPGQGVIVRGNPLALPVQASATTP